MNAAEFEAIAGRPPQKDDLERASCTRAGEFGHGLCGLCPEHKRPRFLCGCLAPGAMAPKDI